MTYPLLSKRSTLAQSFAELLYVLYVFRSAPIDNFKSHKNHIHRYMYLSWCMLRISYTLMALICRWNILLQVEIKQSKENLSSNSTKCNMCRFPENMVILEASYIRNRVSEFQSPICCLLEDFFTCIYPLGMLSTLINICLVNVSWLV